MSTQRPALVPAVEGASRDRSTAVPLKLFVSYCRRDNGPARLNAVEAQLSTMGDVYIDDLHFPPNVDRCAAVTAALRSADVFVAVLSHDYPQTPWTRYEVSEAARRGIPLLLLTEDGKVHAARYEELFQQEDAAP